MSVKNKHIICSFWIDLDSQTLNPNASEVTDFTKGGFANRNPEVYHLFGNKKYLNKIKNQNQKLADSFGVEYKHFDDYDFIKNLFHKYDLSMIIEDYNVTRTSHTWLYHIRWVLMHELFNQGYDRVTFLDFDMLPVNVEYISESPRFINFNGFFVQNSLHIQDRHQRAGLVIENHNDYDAINSWITNTNGLGVHKNNRLLHKIFNIDWKPDLNKIFNLSNAITSIDSKSFKKLGYIPFIRQLYDIFHNPSDEFISHIKNITQLSNFVPRIPDINDEPGRFFIDIPTNLNDEHIVNHLCYIKNIVPESPGAIYNQRCKTRLEFEKKKQLFKDKFCIYHFNFNEGKTFLMEFLDSNQF